MRVAADDGLDRFIADFPDGIANVLTLFLVVSGVVDNQPVVGLDDGYVANGISTDTPDPVCDFLRRLSCL